MFFKTSVLKRLFKDAYKGAGLTVGHMTDPEDEEVDGYLYFFRLAGDLVQQPDIPERSEGGNY